MAIIYKPAGRAGEYAEYAANLYSGCSHGCTYCYAPAATRKKAEQFHGHPAPRKNVLQQLEKDCIKLQGQELPRILLCFTTDPYQRLEEELGITRRAIQIMHKYGFAVQVLTKGGMRASRDFDLLSEKDAFATTLTFLNADTSRQWEPGAASPRDRIEAIRLAHEAGIPTWVSLEPVIDPEETLRIIDETHAIVDLYKVGKLNYHKAANLVDWAKFHRDVVERLDSYGKDYYIKKDLAAYR